MTKKSEVTRIAGMMRDGSFFIRNSGHPRSNSDGYVRRSLLVYEEHHKCCVLDGVVFYHKDGNNQNDDPSNLELFTRSQFSKMYNSAYLPIEKDGVVIIVVRPIELLKVIIQ